MTAVGCGTVEVNPPQRSIKQREKCGLAFLIGMAELEAAQAELKAKRKALRKK